MRILNRPMFRYGGPINEGVMHGMRNNYQSGQLVRPGPGRPGYQGPPKSTSKSKWAAYLATKLPWWSKIKTATKDIIPKTIEKSKQLTLPGMSQPGITGTGAGSAWLTGPAKYWGHMKKAGPIAKNLWGKHRWKTALGAPIAAPYVIDMAKKIPWKGVGDVIKAPYEKWKDVLGIEDKPDEGGDGTDTLTEKIITETGVPGGGDPGMTYIDPGAAERLAKEQQNDRLKNYLDMMGYDRSKKTALSDALIDASALVQDASTEAGSLKKADWGNLINKMIQTTSKRLDKPDQIREAVGLMMTKGEIEKDIAESKGTPLDIKEKYLVGKLGKVAGERGALGKPTSLIEALNATKATDSKGNRTTQALMSYYDGHLVPEFKSKLSSKKIDDLGGEDIFKKDAPIELGDGVYQVSNSYIIVQGKKIIELADVFGED